MSPLAPHIIRLFFQATKNKQTSTATSFSWWLLSWLEIWEETPNPIGRRRLTSSID